MLRYILSVFLLLLLRNASSIMKFKDNKYVDGKLKMEVIKGLCENKESICRNDLQAEICTARMRNSTFEYREFSNACYLLMSNVCDYSGHEFAIVHSGRCRSTESRRIYTVDFAKTTTVRKFYRTIVPVFNGTPSTVYDINMAADGHPCPLRCASTYEPWCMYANGQGKYVKAYSFVSHCAMDAYYCKNWREFEPPPELLSKDPSAETNTEQFHLQTTGCASQRFYYYYHFSELASTLQRHGYLEGDQRFSKILEPNERNPAFG